jgi:tripartite ATP-independent transporter DctM subunit
MEWYWILTIVVGSLILLFLTGFPIAFCFMVINFAGVYIICSGEAGVRQFMLDMTASINDFSLLSLPCFVFMGDIIFETGIATRIIDVLLLWIGKVPGSLSLITVGTATVFGAMSGSSSSAATILGTALMPEMLKRGYKKPMAVGPVVGTGGLAQIIPPSALAIIIATVAHLSIGKLFMAGYIPGLIIATLIACYILIRCRLQPELAPVFEVPKQPLSYKIKMTAINAVPIAIIIFSVMGVIFMGIATPAESAAIGSFASIILAMVYKKMRWDLIKKTLFLSLKMTVMVLFIILGAGTFSRILAFSGAIQSLISLVVNAHVSPLGILILMVVLDVALGCVLDANSQIMLIVPVFMPIYSALGVDPIWAMLILLLCLEIGQTSPPFGMVLFVVKAVAPPEISMTDIYKAGLPYIACDLIGITLVLAFPMLALWLPNMMM